jgi:hypothetical protein
MTNLHRHTCAGRASRTAASLLLLCSKGLWPRSETRRAVTPQLLRATRGLSEQRQDPPPRELFKNEYWLTRRPRPALASDLCNARRTLPPVAKQRVST